MKRTYSLKGKKLFEEVFKKGRRYRGATIQLIVLYGSPGNNAEDKSITCHFGITISRKFGKAVMRNRMKRKIRALLTEKLTVVRQNCNVVIRPDASSLNLPHESLRSEIGSLLTRAGLTP